MRRISAVLAVASVAAYFIMSIQARSFRTGLIPNGTEIDGRGCVNCHVSQFGGGARTPFGEAVRALVPPGSSAAFWDNTLAALDSDGDGFTNGEELQDPNGEWRSGDADPGAPELVSNPGDPDSFTEVRSSVEEWRFY